MLRSLKSTAGFLGAGLYSAVLFGIIGCGGQAPEVSDGIVEPDKTATKPAESSSPGAENTPPATPGAPEPEKE